MSISDGLTPSVFCRKMEEMRPMRKKTDENMFISHQSWDCCFDVCILKVHFCICTLTWHVNNFDYRHGKGLKCRNESTQSSNNYNRLSINN